MNYYFRLSAFSLFFGLILVQAAAQQAPLFRLSLNTTVAPYTSYAHGPFRFTVQVQSMTGAPTPTGKYFYLAEAPRTAHLDSATGEFRWQPTYLDEGKSHPVSLHLMRSDGIELGHLDTVLVVKKIISHPYLDFTGFLSLKPNDQKKWHVPVKDSSNQPCRVTNVIIPSPRVIASVLPGDSTLEFSTSNDYTPLQTTATLYFRNKQDGISHSASISITIEARQLPPIFYDYPSRFTLSENESVNIRAEAFDPNLDAISYQVVPDKDVDLKDQVVPVDLRTGGFLFKAAGLGDQDQAVYKFQIGASDGHSQTLKEYVITVKRALSLSEQNSRIQEFQLLTQSIKKLQDTTTAYNNQLLSYIKRKNSLGSIIKWSIFAVSGAAAIVTNAQAVPSGSAIRLLTVATAVISGLSSVAKTDVSEEKGTREESVRIGNDLITLSAKLNILYGGSRLTGFTLSSDFRKQMDDYKISLEILRVRFLLVYEKFPKVKAWTNQVLRYGHRIKKGPSIF